MNLIYSIAKAVLGGNQIDWGLQKTQGWRTKLQGCQSLWGCGSLCQAGSSQNLGGSLSFQTLAFQVFSSIFSGCVKENVCTEVKGSFKHKPFFYSTEVRNKKTSKYIVISNLPEFIFCSISYHYLSLKDQRRQHIGQYNEVRMHENPLRYT